MDWMPSINITELQNLFLAQTPSPSPSSAATAEIGLLKSQLDFLKQTYSQFVEAMKVIFIVLGIGGGVVAYFFGKNFKEFQSFVREDIMTFREFSRTEVQEAIQRVRQDAETQIPKIVESEVSRIVKAEVASLERTLRREGVIGQTLVDYFLPNGTNEPNELKLLEARNFRRVRFRTTIDSIKRSPGDVVILDLKNWVMAPNQKFSDLPETEQQAPGKEIIQDLLEILPESVVIVVYIPGRLFYLNEIKNRYVIAANNSITLVGNVADGAYVVAGERRT
jgi:hypothetical protein